MIRKVVLNPFCAVLLPVLLCGSAFAQGYDTTCTPDGWGGVRCSTRPDAMNQLNQLNQRPVPPLDLNGAFGGSQDYSPPNPQGAFIQPPPAGFYESLNRDREIQLQYEIACLRIGGVMQRGRCFKNPNKGR